MPCHRAIGRLLHTEAFAQKSAYTQERLHRSLYTEKILHTEAFAQGNYYTGKLLHTGKLHTHKLFTPINLTQRSFYAHTGLHRQCTGAQLEPKILHADKAH
jgi:hypothetical protein